MTWGTEIETTDVLLTFQIISHSNIFKSQNILSLTKLIEKITNIYDILNRYN
jgi:hypothetical protein